MSKQKLYLVTFGHGDSFYIILSASTKKEAIQSARALPGGELTSEVRAEVTERGRHTVNRYYRGPDSTIYKCVAYDWRTGWWMKDEKTGKMKDISERAIGRTYHETSPPNVATQGDGE